ncbi:MAG: anhydro-N-acetylmuramic acid kinase [Chitinophagaceae bacterium]
MLYRAIGLMSGSSLDGLDIVCAAFQENGGKWSFEILAADCLPYDEIWTSRLSRATSLSALDYQLLHIDYGHYLGEQVNSFIRANGLEFKVALLASHGHTSFHLPEKRMTAQLGDGASIAAVTQLPVVSDLRAMDVALGGQGAPIVPVGEQLLFSDYDYYLNLGGIANLSLKEGFRAFDVCPANRVLNLLAAEAGVDYDDKGYLASSGTVNHHLLNELNSLEYYNRPFPKSLANDFGTDIIYPLIRQYALSVYDSLATYVEHICIQIVKPLTKSISDHTGKNAEPQITGAANEEPVMKKMLITGGGAFNSFLVEQLIKKTEAIGVSVIVPDDQIVKYKEALIMGLIGVLRWREETNVLSSVTGARRDSVGGAFWMGQEG